GIDVLMNAMRIYVRIGVFIVRGGDAGREGVDRPATIVDGSAGEPGQAISFEVDMDFLVHTMRPGIGVGLSIRRGGVRERRAVDDAARIVDGGAGACVQAVGLQETVDLLVDTVR